MLYTLYNELNIKKPITIITRIKSCMNINREFCMTAQHFIDRIQVLLASSETTIADIALIFIAGNQSGRKSEAGAKNYFLCMHRQHQLPCVTINGRQYFYPFKIHLIQELLDHKYQVLIAP